MPIIKRSLTSKNPSYNSIIKIINQSISKITPKLTNQSDGRISSALAEQQYLRDLSTQIKRINQAITVVIAQPRHWCDIYIAGIPINLKITNGGTDNAFNKNAIHHTLFGRTTANKSYSKWFSEISRMTMPTKRNRHTEYHYLVYHKKRKAARLCSILEVKEYKSNPTNILQINWETEFGRDITCDNVGDDSRDKLGASMRANNVDHILKKIELLDVVKRSIKEAIAQMSAVYLLD